MDSSLIDFCFKAQANLLYSEHNISNFVARSSTMREILHVANLSLTQNISTKFSLFGVRGSTLCSIISYQRIWEIEFYAFPAQIEKLKLLWKVI
jgi:hypothetical protein